MDDSNAITCPDCNGVMETGFIPDHADGNIPLAMYWQAGEPQPRRFLGLFNLGGWIKAKRSVGVGVRAIRCTHCGLLKLYALHSTPTVKEAWEYPAYEGDDHAGAD